MEVPIHEVHIDDSVLELVADAHKAHLVPPNHLVLARRVLKVTVGEESVLGLDIDDLVC
jgi:hypothetical protein